MNTNFDLNITNYNKKELEDILNLPNNYNESIINTRETKLKHNIINDTNISTTIKKKTIEFLSKVKTKLLSNLYNDALETNKISNQMVVNPILDSSKLIKPVKPIIGQKSIDDVYEGTINPIKKRLLQQNINIDTRFRENYYATLSSNFHITLPICLTKVVSLQLSAIEIPSSFYTISKSFNNNFFVLKIEEHTLIVTIPDGNYNYLGLQNYINKFLETSDPTLPFSQIQFFVDIKNGNGSGKLLVGSKTGDLHFSIDFSTDKFGNNDNIIHLPLKLGWLMGFRHGYYENNTTYIAEGIVNLVGPQYIYLVLDDFNNSINNGFYGAFASSILNKNILARISVQGTPFNITNQNNLTLIKTPRPYFGPVDIQKLQIQLLDEYGRILNLNNMDFSFCISYQTIFNDL